jgi:hypothetical protein
MPWWTFGLGRTPQLPRAEITAAYQRAHAPQALTSAAVEVDAPRSDLLRTTETWQQEVWRYYDTLGEFNYAVSWLSAMLSRVRLYAAELVPGQDEPVRLDDNHPAVDVMNKLAGGVAGQTALMASLAVQLAVPGEGYLVGETRQGAERWSVRSVDEVQARHKQWQVKDENAPNSDQWRDVVGGHVFRVWRPHKRWYHLADSSSRSARATMRELELVNRHILAQYLSRLASAGIWFLPNEVDFPVREEFADMPNPIMAEIVELARLAIAEPGTASAVIPLLMQMPGEWIKTVADSHLDFTLKIDEKIIEKRDSAIKRLATQVNIPAEVLLGMGDVNHWGAWQIEEGALKTTIAPDAELIANAVTTAYLQPRLAAGGEQDTGRFVVWYDMSELTMRPDRSDDAVLLYDRQELSGDALRRETGFDEADKPTGADLLDQALKLVLRTLPDAALTALRELTGATLETPSVAASPAPEPAPEAAPVPVPVTGPPNGNEAAPVPDVGLAVQARAERLIRQARAVHAVRFGMAGWELLHPAACDQHTYSCPFTQGALSLKSMAYPGTPGLYECTLDAFGRFRVGDRAPHKDVSGHRITRSVTL